MRPLEIDTSMPQEPSTLQLNTSTNPSEVLVSFGVLTQRIYRLETTDHLLPTAAWSPACPVFAGATNAPTYTFAAPSTNKTALFRTGISE